mmetsp:Transcript_18905/g.38188  ORF Transcript_18905/g.38188 Transcript_18905/m.38188 type:complete len:136 (-) Transcript_18905:1010-1417(-)
MSQGHPYNCSSGRPPLISYPFSLVDRDERTSFPSSRSVGTAVEGKEEKLRAGPQTVSLSSASLLAALQRRSSRGRVRVRRKPRLPRLSLSDGREMALGVCGLSVLFGKSSCLSVSVRPCLMPVHPSAVEASEGRM